MEKAVSACRTGVCPSRIGLHNQAFRAPGHRGSRPGKPGLEIPERTASWIQAQSNIALGHRGKESIAF